MLVGFLVMMKKIEAVRHIKRVDNKKYPNRFIRIQAITSSAFAPGERGVRTVIQKLSASLLLSSNTDPGSESLCHLGKVEVSTKTLDLLPILLSMPASLLKVFSKKKSIPIIFKLRV